MQHFPSLQEARQQKGLSTSALAHLIGVHRSTLWRYERRHLAPLPIIRRYLAEALNTTPDQIAWDAWQEGDVHAHAQP
jgi:transcriptional regulator with XRE-family HTH domain